jgi:hypothetical protein
VHAVHAIPRPEYPALQVHILESDDDPTAHSFSNKALVSHVLQLTQVDNDEAPSTEEYFPFKHSIQSDALVIPTAVEYVPAGQLVHTVESVELLYIPNGHPIQVLDDVAPEAVEYFPIPQKIHVELIDAPTDTE